MAQPAVEPMPERIEPMKARTGKLPRDDHAWGYEVKWDGVRAVAYLDRGQLALIGRSGTDFTRRSPELRGLGAALGAQRAILDGEIVAFDEQGKPSFERLQARMHLADERAAKRRARDIPAVYVAFDLLWLDGHRTTELPYGDRRRLLAELDLDGSSRAAARADREAGRSPAGDEDESGGDGPRGVAPHWRVPAHHEGDGAALLRATAEQGLEGIIAKRLDSPYEPGRRSSAWIKVKNVLRQELVIGGWSPGEGGRGGRLGALCVGVYDREPGGESAGSGGRSTAGGGGREGGGGGERDDGGAGELRYVGKVGTGFDAESLARVARELAPLRRETSPFDGRQPPRGTVFVEPRLVAEVEFREWTRSGTLRAPSFKGLRPDKDPREVVREA